LTELTDRLQAALGSAYRLERELGGGGMSRVFVAEEVALARKVVVKVLPPEMGAGLNAERFRREIQLAASLQHPHVVPLHAAGRTDDGTRRIPIQTNKQSRGRQVYGGQRHFLPLKVNQAGVMPLIFASTLLIIPNVLGMGLTAINPNWTFLQDAFASHTGFWYMASYVALIIFFSFFWTSLMFQPNDMANNLKEYGSFIPGIRPGPRTAEFLESVMIRITLAGAVFLAVIAILPNSGTQGIGSLDPEFAFFLGGTSILIVVGVALDLVEKIEGLLVMRNYDAAGSAATQPKGWSRKVKAK
jgi:hypothetical protein